MTAVGKPGAFFEQPAKSAGRELWIAWIERISPHVFRKYQYYQSSTGGGGRQPPDGQAPQNACAELSTANTHKKRVYQRCK